MKGIHYGTVLFALIESTWAFRAITFSALHSPALSRVLLAGQGFGKQPESTSESGQNKSSRPVPAKTYGKAAGAPIRDMIDAEAAMKDFFEAREDWTPLFRAMMADASCQAMSFLGEETSDVDIDFHETSAPWRKLEAIPKEEGDKQIVAGFLDSMHQSLLDIPVTESKEEDENDMHFLEEGRRMLAISRFQVLREVTGGSVECFDRLFSTCWSELMYLQSTAEAHTGSLILLPDYNLSDLRRFADMNLLWPLEWLGVHNDFEVVSLERQSPAIRLLYKLNAIPSTEEIESREPASE